MAEVNAEVNQGTQAPIGQGTTTTSATTATVRQAKHKIEVGEVVSTKMHKTIVVQVIRKKAHPLYQRVVANKKKFYAHDEESVANVGDIVRLEETRPLSKLKRWKLTEVVRKAPLVAGSAKAAAK